MGIGGHIHIEVVTEEIKFAMGVPSSVTVRLGILAFTVTGRSAIFLAIAGSLFSLLCSGTDRGSVTGESQVFLINKSLRVGNGEELLVIKPENEKEWIF